MSPRLENDSIVYAYSAALDRKNKKRKRDDYLEESLNALFSTPANKRLITEEEEEEESQNSNATLELIQIENNLRSLNERLDKIKKKYLENESVITDIKNFLN